MKVIFMGSNPSNASPTSDAFTNCKSRKTLDKWIKQLDIPSELVTFSNVSGEKTPSNRPLTVIESMKDVFRVGMEINGNVVIALGGTAYKTVKRIARMNNESWKPVDVIHLPHPSGRNHKLNDTAYVLDKLSEAKKRLSKWIIYPIDEITPTGGKP